MKQLLVILALACSLALAGPAQAQKGRSFSSGGSSFSRPSASNFGRSFSSGASSAAKPSSFKPSFSVPKTVPSSPSTSKPIPAPAVGAKSAKPAGGSFDSAAAAAQRKAVSKSAYEARKSPNTSSPPSPPAGGALPGGRVFSSGGPPVNPPAPAGRSYSTGKAPTRDAYDAKAAAAQRREESKAAYAEAQKPRTTYKTPQGETRPFDPADQRVERIRRQVDARQWSTRAERRRQIYVVTQPYPVAVYHDPYSDWFWFWLLTRDLDTRASWAYHYHDQMDTARYRDLLAKDAQLEARIRQLEAKGLVRDSTYVPPGVDNDLMYDDGFVEAAVNPQPTSPTAAPTARPTAPPTTPPALSPTAPPVALPTVPPAVHDAHRHSIVGTLGKILLILAVMAFLVWLVFIKRWGGT